MCVFKFKFSSSQEDDEHGLDASTDEDNDMMDSSSSSSEEDENHLVSIHLYVQTCTRPCTHNTITHTQTHRADAYTYVHITWVLII